MLSIFYNFSYYFLIYSALGWCVEVMYSAITTKTFINRGFLNGPVCPMYGFGACLIVFGLSPLKEHFVVLYLCSVLLISALELVTGFLLERFFNARWWDYSIAPLNFKGYICLPFSLLWGVVCIATIYWIHPIVIQLVSILPPVIGWIILIPLLGVMFTDVCLTLRGIGKYKKTITLLNDIEEVIRKISDTIGENLADFVFSAIEVTEKNSQKLDEIKDKYSEFLAKKGIHNLSELKEKYKDLLGKKELRVGNRLTKAFPDLKKNSMFDMVEKRLQSIKRIRHK